jgi:hypothetical protein
MRRSLIGAAVAAVSILVSTPGLAAPGFALVGSYTTGLASGDGDLTSGETAAVYRKRMFVTNASDASLDIVNIADPAAPELVRRVDLGAWGATVTSVAIAEDGNLVAVAVVPANKVERGRVVFLSRSGEVRGVRRVGALPDMLTFTPDGNRLLVANEGEPDCYGPGCTDPAGSISVIEIRRWQREPGRVHRIGFAELADTLPEEVRIFGPGASVPKDLEPEYIAVADDGATAWVTLQENNAVAEVDLVNLRVTRVAALGTKDHGQEGAGLDASDRDGAINIQPWPGVRGMYMPDAIAAFASGGETYLLTANEGDAREYPHPLDSAYDFAEESRAEDLAAEPGLSDIVGIGDETQLGRLNVTLFPPGGDDTNLYSFGARSLTVWNAGTGALVWDSGDAIEQLVAGELPEHFNKGNDANDGFDGRSDNKGPEPEGVVVGNVGGTDYAFVGLERIGGIVVFDLTDPAEPTVAEYLQNRDFSTDIVGPDSGPEVLKFVDGERSPNGKPLLAVANEITGTVTLWQPAD